MRFQMFYVDSAFFTNWSHRDPFSTEVYIKSFFFWCKIEDSSYLNAHYTEDMKKRILTCYKSTKMSFVWFCLSLTILPVTWMEM